VTSIVKFSRPPTSHLHRGRGPHTVPRTVSSGNPFSIGLRAARANLVPGLVIQTLMVALVLVYYFAPPARGWFVVMANAKGHWGYAFSFTSAVIAGAVLPMLFKIVLVQRGRLTRADFSELLFLAVFWGSEGIVVDALYRFQVVLFGSHVDFPTIVKKVLVDQLVFNPVFAIPYTLSCYELRRHGYRFRSIGHAFTAGFYRTHTIPTLCATWCVWIPVTCAIYALPSLLQIPLFALALTFWVLMLAYITTRQHKAEPISAPLTEAVAE